MERTHAGKSRGPAVVPPLDVHTQRALGRLAACSCCTPISTRRQLSPCVHVRSTRLLTDVVNAPVVRAHNTCTSGATAPPPQPTSTTVLEDAVQHPALQVSFPHHQPASSPPSHLSQRYHVPHLEEECRKQQCNNTTRLTLTPKLNHTTRKDGYKIPLK